jgi:cellulose synthase/poly-beta-1,6-N-acetylglucosamine synthase-like glycosyltransferase
MREFTKELAIPPIEIAAGVAPGEITNKPRPGLYLVILTSWILSLLWFHPRLLLLLGMAYDGWSWMALAFFIVFVEFAWLYGFYNVSVVVFSILYRHFWQRADAAQAAAPPFVADAAPAVAILYTTCNDFVEASARSCVEQDYPHFTVYICDDSSDPVYQARVDAFAAAYPDVVEVIRRKDRQGFKAGNMNHALSEIAVREPFFAIADADEILPTDFLAKLTPIIAADPACGFLQANHRANPNAESPLARAQGIGIDIHWKWYQPLRNRFGFVMFLGHGALLRRRCWEEIGGFPHIVSEDLGFAIRIREKGYRGRFVEDVICYEDFPDTVRAFRIRHMKWTRGTCEFLAKEALPLIRSQHVTWMEKLDILFPTLNLPLTLLYFLFMVNANLLLPMLFGQTQVMTLEIGDFSLLLPITGLSSGFTTIFTPDFFAITMMTFFAPVLCFILAMAHRPLALFRFLSHSTALYAALGTLSAIGVLAYLISGKAIFLVTGDLNQEEKKPLAGLKSGLNRLREGYRDLINRSHPDRLAIQIIEVFVGAFFAAACVHLFQVSFFGLCLAFVMLPVMHYLGWHHKVVRVVVYVPFLIILAGVVLAGMSTFGMQTVFFGYGFHF